MTRLALTVLLAAAAELGAASVPIPPYIPPPLQTGALTPPATGPSNFLGPLHELDQLDTPPRAVLAVKPDYPAPLRAQGIAGWAEIELTLNGSGQIHAARVVASSRPEFEAPAYAAAIKSKYAPGKKEGRSVATRLTVKMEFRR